MHTQPSMLGRWLAGKLQATVGDIPVRFVLWDGAETSVPGSVPVATVHIRQPSGLGKFLVDPEIWFGDGYSQGWIEVDGDLVSTLATLYRSVMARPPTRRASGLLAEWLTWKQRNSLGGSRRNIHQHYDLNTDFFRLWLDSQLIYTGAYFTSPDCTLEDAQIAKMDHVCRKVLLHAAGLAFEQSGEGIRPAIESGILAAQVILAANCKYSNERLQPYCDMLESRFRPPRRSRANALARLCPDFAVAAVTGFLLASPRFTRHVLLDRWFLRAGVPAS